MHGTVGLKRFLGRHRPNRRDIAVAAVITLVELLAPRTGPPASDPGPALAVVGLILASAQGVPLAWRRTSPVAVLALVTAAFLAHALAL